MKPGDQKEPDERLDERDENEALSPVPFAERSIVLVGLMGAGKTTVGRRLARRQELQAGRLCGGGARHLGSAGAGRGGRGGYRPR